MSKAAFTTNEIVRFTGYSEPLEKGQKPILTKGEKVRITGQVDAESFNVVSVNNPKAKDSVFNTEIEALKISAAPAAKADKAAKVKAPAEKPAAAAKVPQIKKGKAPAAKPAPAKAEKAAKTKKVKAEKPAKAPKAVKPEAEELKPLAMSAYSEDVQKQVKSDASALKAAKSLAQRIQETFWTLGGVLSFIQRNKSFVKVETEAGEHPYAGSHGFKNYVEVELGMKYRRAMYYVSIYETFSPLGVEQETVLALGWAKAKELTGVVNKKNVQGWLKKADELGREDLQAEIKQSKVKAGDGDVNPPAGPTATATTFKFRLFEDQGKVVASAIKDAQEKLGEGADENAAFAHIVSEWAVLNGTGAKPDIDTAFASLENSYGLADVSSYAKSHYGKGGK